MTGKERKCDLYMKEYENGMSYPQIARKYSIAEATVKQGIDVVKTERERLSDASEWVKCFTNKTALALHRNNITCEEDIYRLIESKKEVRGIGKQKIDELNEKLQKKIDVCRQPVPVCDWRTDYKTAAIMGTCLKYATEVQKKPINLCGGHFRGTINGVEIEGQIYGEYYTE